MGEFRAPPSRERGSRCWVTARGSIAAIAAIDPGVADATFGSRSSIAIGGWPGSTTGRAWASCERFAADVGAGTIQPEVEAVMYDPEAWEATPDVERRDPIAAIGKFTSVAREHGYTPIITPHPGLVHVAGAKIVRRAGETREGAYLRSGISYAAAMNADLIEAQAQRLQRDPALYRPFVLECALQARAANPDVIVLSGLSTHPGYRATPGMLFAAWESVRDVVDGHYLSLARLRHPDVAAAFLRMVVEAGDGTAGECPEAAGVSVEAMHTADPVVLS